MRTGKNNLPRLFVVLSLALAGLMALQVMLLRYAWDLKQQAFHSGAQTALASAVLSLQSREIEGSAYNYFFSQADSATTVTAFVRPEAVAPRSDAGRLQRFRSVQREIRRLGVPGAHGLHGDSLVVVIAPPDARRAGEVLSTADPAGLTLRHVVGEWINQAPRPIRERLDAAEIAGVLREELATAGIGAEPAFGVVSPARLHRAGLTTPVRWSSSVDAAGEIVLASDNITDAELRDSPFRQQLFPLDPFEAPFELVLAFPQDRLYLVRQIGPLWLASVVFISVIIFSFVRAWRTNAEQRRFAGQLVDFINNMTHEFKTPIATVALAGEAMARRDVQAQPEVMDRYVGMVRDENERMHRQVDKILQMARFEQGEIEMKREVVDVHEVLKRVADSFALQVERRGGTLARALAAPAFAVIGDAVHLESIFANLVDNAVKYAVEAPRVRIATAADGGQLTVKVTDAGPGIPREDQRRVFERYYRRPTGDRHDVKGFGLGLSFVRSLVQAHGGHVELHSLPGKGTTVTVSLPLAPAAQEIAP